MDGQRSGQLSLKADEPHVDQCHEDVERKRGYYHITILPERTGNFISRKKRKSEHHSYSIV